MKPTTRHEIAQQLMDKIDANAHPIPEVGIHEGVPFKDYLAWNAVSSSMLRARNPRRMRWEAANDKDTEDLQLGRAVHAALLEPRLFEREWARGPQYKQSKADKERWAQLESVHGPGFVLRNDAYDQVLAMRDSVLSKLAARALFSDPAGQRELSIVWRDPDTELLCKARIDYFSPGFANGAGIGVDLKTARDASPFAFNKAIFDRGYGLQGAHYLTGIQALGMEARHFGFIVPEKDGDYDVGFYRLSDDDLRRGEDLRRVRLKRLRNCYRINLWPGYPDRFIDTSAPIYAVQEIENEVAEFELASNPEEIR